MPILVIHIESGSEIKIDNSSVHSILSVWDSFLVGQSSGNAFQSSRFFLAYSEAKLYDPYLIIVIRAEKIIGGVLGVIQCHNFGIFSNLTARAIIWGGPIVVDNDPTILKVLIDKLLLEIHNKAIYVQIRSLFDPSWMNPVLQNLGFRMEDHLNILIDLKKDKDILWKEVSAKRRNEIRKGQRSGLVIIEKSDSGGLKEAYRILSEVYSRARIPLPGIDFFNSLLKVTDKNANLKIFLGHSNARAVGCMLVITFPNRVIDFYAGSYSQFYDKCPNDFITWEVIKWSKTNGYRIFDFGGAGKPGKHYGVRDFKMKFGGELVNLSRFEKELNPFKMKAARTGYFFWRKTKNVFK